MTAPNSTEKSKIKIKVKDPIKGDWKPIIGIAGKTIRQIFQQLDGTESVCEYSRGEKVWYFCGTDLWIRTMKKRGKAISFIEAIQLLGAISPAWLEEIPVTDAMERAIRLMGQNEPCLEIFEEL